MLALCSVRHPSHPETTVNLTRRDTLILAASAAMASTYGLGTAQAQEGTTKDVAKLAAVALPDHVLGSEAAPVTVIEYASPTCPHCAAFSNTVYPQFKTEYIDTGKVKFILRPFVRNVLDAVVFMLAEAAGPEQYHSLIETYFKTQDQWGVSDKPRDAILAIAKQLGFTDASFDAALTNSDLFTKMETMRQQALDEFNLEGTPTFYVNGAQLTGDKTIEDLRAVIDPLIPAGFTPTQPAPAADAAAPATPAAPAGANAVPATPAPAGETSTPVQ
jgi:protein-disulfide isomerase